MNFRFSLQSTGLGSRNLSEIIMTHDGGMALVGDSTYLLSFSDQRTALSR